MTDSKKSGNGSLRRKLRGIKPAVIEEALKSAGNRNSALHPAICMKGKS
jgi:hypothetical protein